MFITKKHIPRRTFLRGAGVTLALPLLESMVPAVTPLRLTAAAATKRFVGIWHPHGAAPGYWSPLQEGKDFDFSFITKPLEPFRNRTVLITGLDMPETMATDDEPGGHPLVHAGRAVAQDGVPAVGPIGQLRELDAEPHVGTELPQVVEQDRLDVVLRNARGQRRALGEHGAHVGRVARGQALRHGGPQRRRDRAQRPGRASPRRWRCR